MATNKARIAPRPLLPKVGIGAGGPQGVGKAKQPVRSSIPLDAHRRVVKGALTSLPNPQNPKTGREGARDLGGPKRNQTVVGAMPIAQSHGGGLRNPPMYARTKPKSVLP